MVNMDIIDSVPALPRDRRITLCGGIAQIKTEHIILTDKFTTSQALKSTPSRAFIKIPGGSPDHLTKPFFQPLNGLAMWRCWVYFREACIFKNNMGLKATYIHIQSGKADLGGFSAISSY
jgi:hypothetical protein